MFDQIYRGKSVLLTGHTGFKGSWLALWLTQLGARITGYALPPPTLPSHFSLLDLDVESITGDIRDRDNVLRVFREKRPEIVFHLAAQAIVRHSYDEPAETFASNAMGTVNVLEAARACGTVRAVVNVTSDKCYDNREWVWGYRENDPLGGYDPYSASKACAELITNCWRNSFFNPAEYGRAHETLLASARAGNVIGGGDWASDRLIPDIMRAVSKNIKVSIRNPNATRPWQHVLEPLSGYLLLGQRLLEGQKQFAEAWNLGPSDGFSVSVREIVRQIQKSWPKINFEIRESSDQPHEAGKLNLDCTKAETLLKWSPVWNGKTAIDNTVQWYRAFYESGTVRSLDDFRRYTDEAAKHQYAWVKS